MLTPKIKTLKRLPVEACRTQNASHGCLCWLIEEIHFDPVFQHRRNLLVDMGPQKGDPFLAGAQNPPQIGPVQLLPFQNMIGQCLAI